mgnify:FL=1
MIKSLKINNYTLFQNVSIEFENGFSVISGETGSGKSILLDALTLLLGKRVDRFANDKLISKAVIEGVFIFKKSKYSFFEKNDIDFEEFTIIRREILPNGKSRAFINDTPVLLNVLLQFSNQFFEIHSQHESLLLKDKIAQFSLLDGIANSEDILLNFQQELKKYNQLLEELVIIRESRDLKENDVEFIKYQLEELVSSDLKLGEIESIRKKIKLLENIDDIANAISLSEELLNNEQGVLSQISTIKKSILQFDSFKDLYERLDSIIIELNDISSEFLSLNQNLKFNPEELLSYNNRIDHLNKLLHKHRKKTIEELIEYRDELENKLSFSESYVMKFEEKEKELSDQLLILEEAVSLLNRKRLNILPDLQNKIEIYLKKLGMPYAKFKIDIKKTATFHNFGNTSISFLFSANKGGELQEISKVSSGGELSRLMLAIKFFSARSSNLDVLFFDEIDTGVSGEIASLMGDMMKDISQSTQLIAISHLPQIASKADEHYKVLKSVVGEKTISDVYHLNYDERVNEIAKLLSGKEVTNIAFENARVLLNQ